MARWTDRLVGRVVKLNSGGPPMIVVEIRENMQDMTWDLICEWTNDDGRSERAVFPSATVSRFEPPLH